MNPGSLDRKWFALFAVCLFAAKLYVATWQGDGPWLVSQLWNYVSPFVVVRHRIDWVLIPALAWAVAARWADSGRSWQIGAGLVLVVLIVVPMVGRVTQWWSIPDMGIDHNDPRGEIGDNFEGLSWLLLLGLLIWCAALQTANGRARMSSS